MSEETVGIQFPLDMTSGVSGYELSDLQNSVRFNIKNIILTNPGERIMLPDFGVGVNAMLFELSSFDLLDLLQQRINQQIRQYAPYVTILELIIEPISENALNIRLKYEVDFAEILDSIDLNITNI